MAKDDALREVLGNLAKNSDGRLSFKAMSATQLSHEFGLQLTRSTNPVYVFALRSDDKEVRQFIAFTLALDGSGRPATRAEALGRSLAGTDGELFKLNPLLLVYDYVGQRLLAVSAMELFDAFAAYSVAREIPYSESASFSLSPSFQNSTISMYAEVRPPVVWATSAKESELSEASLTSFLNRVAQATSAKHAEVARVVNAIKARINAVAASPGPSTDVSLTNPAVSFEDYVSLAAEDDAVQIDDRLWTMLLSAISSSPATLLVGPPGTGKSALVRKAVATISEGQMEVGQKGVKPPLWATPDESWTSRELIGGETVAGGEVVFRPGWVLKAISEGRWLVLDEANRGDLDRIFGALLTWLSGGRVAVGVESTAADAKLIELGWTKGPCRIETDEGVKDERRGAIRYLAGDDWRLLGTYNALDSQRVFRLGAALGRRFVRVPIPPLAPASFRSVALARDEGLPSALLERLVSLYGVHYAGEVTRLGPALFLGMASYMRAALRNRGLSANVEGGAIGTAGGQLPSAETSATAGPVLAAAAVGPTITAEILGEILSEAYVLNVGTHLAQLEEPDFQQLMQRAKASFALTEGEVEWVSGMMQALA